MGSKNLSFVDLTKDQLVDLILEKFATQRELADKLGISEGNLSNKLKNPSRKFIKELEKYGIVINDHSNRNIINGSGGGKESTDLMVFNMAKELGELRERVSVLERKLKLK
ncbi:MAG TPA: hypothetical protein PLZ15_14105 [Melioribacteraceae bacterium]|nr:hypothetical protein [Melioribacteraceae bacterium]